MAIEVFNRYENKYMLDVDALYSFEKGLSDYMELDDYNKKHATYTITNLYYDTADHFLIHTSLLKPRYKEKLRLRAYGVPSLEDKVYIEIKKKVSGLVNKRRSGIVLADAYRFVTAGLLPAPQPIQNRQVFHEIAYMLQQYPLQPRLYLAYDRRAYFACTDHDLRISFDRNIRARRTALQLEVGDQGRPLITSDQVVMEIKAAQSMPVWLTRLLAEHNIYSRNFSKYGTEYVQMLDSMQRTLPLTDKDLTLSNEYRKREETIACLTPCLPLQQPHPMLH